jgi:hypothetical protein
MWALPNIVQMNAEKVTGKAKHEHMLEHPEEYDCDCCDKKGKCAEAYYDIFSDEISGVSISCQSCRDRGVDEEGFFFCDSCNRRMIENITWELYYKWTDDGQICLACAAEQHFEDPENLIEAKEITEIVREPGKDGKLWDPETGVLNLFKAPHVLGVEQPVPKGWVNTDEGYATFDSMDGHQIDGHDFEGQIRGLKHPFLLIMDGAFQFAVRLAIYQKEGEEG